MKRLLWIELRAQYRLMLLAILGLLIVAFLLRMPPLVYLLAGLGPFGFNFSSKRSHWYHQLPFSRKKIATLLIVQNLISFAICFGISAILHLALSFFFAKAVRLEDIGFYLLLSVGGLFYVFLNPVTGVSRPRNQWTDIQFDNKFAKTIAIPIGIAGLFLLAWWKAELLMTMGLIAAAPIILPLTFSNQFVFAPKTHRNIKRFVLVAFAVLLAVLLACYLAT